MAKAEGVFPCYKNQFHIGDAAESKNDIAECESFSVSIDNGVETWNSFTQEGWQSALQTGKAITISVSAKRSIGDPGNDLDRKSTRLNSSHRLESRMPSSA